MPAPSPVGVLAGCHQVVWVWMKRLDAVRPAGVSLTCVEWLLATHFGVVPRDAFAAVVFGLPIWGELVVDD